MPSSRRAKTRSGKPSLCAPCARRFSPAKAAATAERAPRMAALPLPSRLPEARRAAATRAPEAARPRSGPAEVRLGTKGVLSPTISPTMRSWSRGERRPRSSYGVPFGSGTSPRRMARASRAGAAIERRPDRAANARVSLVVLGGVTGRIRRLSKGAPDFEFGLDVADDLVGELAGAGGAAEFGGTGAFEDAFEGGLVDGARDPVGLLVAEVREERGARQDHGHRVRHVLALQGRRRAVRRLGHHDLGVLLLVERDEQRLRPRDGAEHLQHHVGHAVPVAVQGRY